MRQYIAIEVAVNRALPTYGKLNKREDFTAGLNTFEKRAFNLAKTTYFLCTVRRQMFVKLFSGHNKRNEAGAASI